jgi:DNA-binding CsgD family transcriptional regulator
VGNGGWTTSAASRAEERLGPRPDRVDALLERDGELARLTTLLRGALAGEAHVVLVEGAAGIGKSRLLAEVRREATAARMRVLAARGSELEREFPFGVVRQLFETTLADPQVAASAFAGAAEAARPIFASLSGSVAEGDASFAALHGLFWLTVNLTGESPVLLAVDDLHWCDRPSLRFLAYLVRRLEGLPVLLAGSLRPAEPGADLALLAEIAHDPLAVSVRPAPLSPGGAEALVRERLGRSPDDAFGRALHRATGGNPLLLHELLKALEAERIEPTAANLAVVEELGPRAASRSVLLRLSRLPAETVAVARAAAVLGEGTDYAAVAALAGVSEAAAADASGLLARAEILRPELPLAFVHPLVHAAVYHDVPPGERELRHAHAARLLADARAPEEQVAAHMLAMPRQGDPWVVDTLVHAAGVAAARGAAESAVTYLRRALEEPPPEDRRTEVLLALGQAEGLTDGTAAAEHLRAAYDALSDPVARAQIAVGLSSVLVFTGRAAEGAALAAEAQLPLDPDDDLRPQLEAHRLTAAHFDDAAVAVVSPEFALHRGKVRPVGWGPRMLGTAAAYQWAMTGGPADACVELALDALGDGSILEEVGTGGPVMGAVIVLALADRPEAIPYCERALAGAHRNGSMFHASGGYLFRGFTLLQRGELAEAETNLRSGAELTAAWGSFAVELYPAAYLAETLAERGDLDGARAALARAGAVDKMPTASNQGWWFAGRLRLLLAEGALEEALRLSEEAERRLGERVVNPAWLPWRSARAEALDRLGRREEAVAIAAEEVELARRWGAPRALGRALRVLGTAAREDGLPQLEEAVAVLDGSLARLEHAKALGALGTALRHAGRPSDAREPLRQALELASVCEAAPLVEHVRAELYATGSRPRSESLSGVESLTPSERRVAGLAADGQSNREIAQALYVTPKTVELHLSNAYRKLRIRSRRELAGALAG